MDLRASFIVTVALSAAAFGSEGAIRQVTFDEQKAGESPAGFTCVLTGNGRAGAWKIVEDATAPTRPNAIGQRDEDATSYRFPVCVLDGVSARDVDLSVRSRPSGARRARPQASSGAIATTTTITSCVPTRWEATWCSTR